MAKKRGERDFRVSNHADVLCTVGIVGLIFLLIIPISPFFLDFFLSLNIALSMIVLLHTLYVKSVFEFSSFPSLLLFLTLFRLTLNIASTRLILTEGIGGEIIQTFGDFVIRGNEIVGLLIFFLLTLINFSVITKGASRIAEVSARFILEGLPGRQMAIDNELSSGILSQNQAHEERKRLDIESHFYGSMDGASKFVKGDAMAGLVIILMNLVGGMMIGMFVWKMSWQQCWSSICRLTIGDGLVTQIPALFVSMGSAAMVARTTSTSLSQILLKQICHHPKVLLIAASLLFILGLLPGMPLTVFCMLSILLSILGYYQFWKHNKIKDLNNESSTPISTLVPPIELQLGFQAIALGKSFQERVGMIRAEIAHHLGIAIPSIRISDQTELPPMGWAILVKGIKVDGGREADIVLLKMKLIEVIKKHSHELLNRQDLISLLNEVKVINRAVVDELYAKKVSHGQILKVLQNLLKEGVPIRDLVTILETLADHAVGEKNDLDALTEEVRQSIAAKITDQFIGKEKLAYVITVDPKIEQMLTVSKGLLRPKIREQLTYAIVQLEAKANQEGIKPIVVTSVASRAQLRRVIERQLPHIPVLSYSEMTSDVQCSSVGMVNNEVLI